MASETVRDVCAEITDATMRVGAFFTPTIYGWRNRILAAYEREMAAKEAAHRQWRDNYKARLSEKDAEIARLKAALKPVMDCNPNEDVNHTIYEWGFRNSNAVREAQAIMKGGEV